MPLRILLQMTRDLKEYVTVVVPTGNRPPHAGVQLIADATSTGSIAIGETLSRDRHIVLPPLKTSCTTRIRATISRPGPPPAQRAASSTPT